MFCPIGKNGLVDDKVEDIMALFFASDDDCPNTLALAHACLAASVLRNTPIDNRMAYIPLSAVICRLKHRFGHEPEIIFGSVAFKASGKCFCQFMLRRTTYNLQSHKLLMAGLAANFSFCAVGRRGLVLFDNIRQGRVGRIRGVLLKPSDYF